MLSTILIAACVIGVFGDIRNFAPQIPGKDHHKLRVWVWLMPKCFETESSVRSFKDYLLDSYECIDFNSERKIIYKQPALANGDKIWSLWLEKKGDNFNCLSENITLPNNLVSECINQIYYEPLQYIDECVSQPISVPGNAQGLWSLDNMDGIQNNAYHYFAFSDAATNDKVKAIILDTGVDTTHVEFFGLDTQNLFTGTPAPTMSYDHGTHVAGTVVGDNVGGAKTTDLYYYPVCQQGNSCAWSDIEGGYETAIAVMMSDPDTIYVINYSVGGSKTDFNEPYYEDWGMRIQNEGGFWVTSAGNNNADACNYAPSFTSYALTIGSYDVNRFKSSFSNYGTCVDTWGPGTSVWSCLPADGYGYFSGTSMSSPNICAVTINVLKENPTMTLPQLKTYMLSNSFDVLGVPSGGIDTGAFWNSGCPTTSA